MRGGRGGGCESRVGRGGRQGRGRTTAEDVELMYCYLKLRQQSPTFLQLGAKLDMGAQYEVGAKGVVSAVDPETLLWRQQPSLLPL